MYLIYDDCHDHIIHHYKEKFRPYLSSVLNLLPIGTNQKAGCRGIVASYGEKLNPLAFQRNYRSDEIYPSDHKELLLDRKFLNKTSKPLARDSSGDLLLFWDAPNGKTLKRLNMERDDSNETNERLKDIRNHSKYMFKSSTLNILPIRSAELKLKVGDKHADNFS